MAATRRFWLTGLLGALGLSVLGIRVETPPSATSGYVITKDGWVVRPSDLDLVR
jgi:hypothetical protein